MSSSTEDQPILSHRKTPTYKAMSTRSSLSIELPEERRLSIGSNCEDNESDKISFKGEEPYVEERPWKFKLIALICVLTLSLGSHYAGNTLDALKLTIKKELGISNTQYGIIQSSQSLVNTILPVLGGIFIDTFGTSIGSLLATFLIATGNIFVALSINLRSFTVMIIGRILYGIGSGTIITAQVAILCHWFKGKGLAIVVGTQIATSRLSSFLGNLTVVPIKNATGFYGWAFWFSAFLCVISLIINILYVYLMRIFDENLSNKEMMKLKQKGEFKPKKLLLFPTIFWIFVLIEFELGGIWTSFLHIHTELVKTRWNGSEKISEEYAAYNSSIAQFLPIFVAPFFGYFLDRFGNRTLTLIISTVFLVISTYLLGFIALTPIIAVAGMVCFSISLSLGPVVLLSSIPILLPLDYVGTALGVIKSSLNIGSTIFDIIVGLLQDMDNDKYEKVMHLFLISSIIAILICILLYYVSKNWHHDILDMKEVDRRENPEILKFEERPTKMNYFYIVTFIIVLIISWILYLLTIKYVSN